MKETVYTLPRAPPVEAIHTVFVFSKQIPQTLTFRRHFWIRD